MAITFGEVFRENNSAFCAIGWTHVDFEEAAVSLGFRFYGDRLVVSGTACTLGEPVRGQVNGYVTGTIAASSRDYAAIKWAMDRECPPRLYDLALRTVTEAVRLVASDIEAFVIQSANTLNERLDVEAAELRDRLIEIERLKVASMVAKYGLVLNLPVADPSIEGSRGFVKSVEGDQAYVVFDQGSMIWLPLADLVQVAE